MASLFPPLTPEARRALAEYESLYAQWRAADDAAQAAERQLETSWRCGVLGPPPDLELEARALALRLEAARIAEHAVAVVRSAPI